MCLPFGKQKPPKPVVSPNSKTVAPAPPPPPEPEQDAPVLDSDEASANRNQRQRREGTQSLRIDLGLRQPSGTGLNIPVN